MADSPIFIVGCPRSGTSLIRDLLRSHPNITIPKESHFIPKFYKTYGNPRNEREACGLAKTILNLYWVKNYELSLEASSFAHYRRYDEIISKIFQEWARKENKPRWGDKTPQYVTEIPTLVELFPSCKIIHIFRDGRDVALSLLRMYFGPENVFTAASVWEHMVTAGRRAGEAAGPERYMEVRYETLLDQPGDTMEAVCKFLDEPFTERVLKRDIDLAAQKSVKTEIERVNQKKWKIEMSHSERVIFESVAGDLLEALGYETEGIGRPIGSPERLMWKVHNSYKYALRQLGRGQKTRWLPGALMIMWADIRRSLNFDSIINKFSKKPEE